MESEFIFEGKKYISAAQASKITGYNSDYIGQLCRKNSLECRRVGRVWFVNEDSLTNHEKIAAQTPRGRIAVYDKKINAVKVSSKFHVLVPGPSLESSTRYEQGLKNSEFAFKSLNQADQSFEDCFAEKKQMRSFVTKVISGSVALLLIIIFISGFLTQASSTGTAYFFNAPEITFFEKSISQVFVPSQNSNSEINNSSSNSANVSQAIKVVVVMKINQWFEDSYAALARIEDIFNLTRTNIKFAFSNAINPNVHASQAKDRNGIVIVPSSGNSKVDDRVRRYVNDSFSDETVIVPGQSGNSGLIKPVFKNKNDQEYLYIVVPVKEKPN